MRQESVRQRRPSHDPSCPGPSDCRNAAMSRKSLLAQEVSEPRMGGDVMRFLDARARWRSRSCPAPAPQRQPPPFPFDSTAAARPASWLHTMSRAETYPCGHPAELGVICGWQRPEQPPLRAMRPGVCRSVPATHPHPRICKRWSECSCSSGRKTCCLSGHATLEAARCTPPTGAPRGARELPGFRTKVPWFEAGVLQTGVNKHPECRSAHQMQIKWRLPSAPLSYLHTCTHAHLHGTCLPDRQHT
jgi:hypothetical protein